MSEKEQFLSAFMQEHAITMKVLRAFPVDKGEFRPHPRSQSARELAFTFVVEQAIMAACLTDTLDVSKGFPKAPAEFAPIIDQFDSDYKNLVELIKKTPEDRLSKTVKFFVAPGQMGDVPVAGMLWFVLHDQIHHRGQYSVYVRMAGGKVPSIYGPSADEPWM